MSRFYVSGRLGNNTPFKAGGIRSVNDAHVRGWNGGIEVDTVALADGSDRFDVYMTPGSNGDGHRVLLGSVESRNDGRQRGRFPRWRPAKGRKSVRKV